MAVASGPTGELAVEVAPVDVVEVGCVEEEAGALEEDAAPGDALAVVLRHRLLSARCAMDFHHDTVHTII